MIIDDYINDPMLLALNLAKKGKYTVSPNPMVGAVLVKNGKIIGYGYHKFAGGVHAEVEAIKMAGDEACGADLYVTLEPCCHHGRTPPCVDLIIKSKIKKVFVATLDSNPNMNGSSIGILKEAGIEVEIGQYEKEARALNKSFFYYMKHKKPYVIAKFAMTLDAKIALGNYESKWISNQDSRKNAHRLRNSVDAVLVGYNTLKYDNPTLNIRDADVDHIKNPLKVVIDYDLSIDLSCNLLKNEPEKVVLFYADAKDVSKKEKLELLGAKLIKIKTETDYIAQLLLELGELGVSRLLVEGGSKTHAKFLKNRLINEIYCYLAPKISADNGAISIFSSDDTLVSLKDAYDINFEDVERIGSDILIKATLKEVEKCSQG